jgi:hypothetical protein
MPLAMAGTPPFPALIRQLETLRHFQDWDFRNILVLLVAKHLSQEENILKNFVGNRSLFHSAHKPSLLKLQKAPLRIHPNERLCSFEGSVAFDEVLSQPLCQAFHVLNFS